MRGVLHGALHGEMGLARCIVVVTRHDAREGWQMVLLVRYDVIHCVIHCVIHHGTYYVIHDTLHQVVLVRRQGEHGWVLPGGLLPRNSAEPPSVRQLRMIFSLQACIRHCACTGHALHMHMHMHCTCTLSLRQLHIT